MKLIRNIADSLRLISRKNILLILGGSFCSYKSIAEISKGATSIPGAIAIAIIAVAWATAAGMCFAHIIAPKVGDLFASLILYPLEYLKKPADRFSRIRGLVEQEKYQEAIAALNEILDRKPFDPAAHLLLVEVYMDRLNDIKQTVELIEKYFLNRQGNPKVAVFPENVEMLMRYSDICLAHNRPDLAISLFQIELADKGYSEPEKNVLTLRLEALNGKLKIEN